MNTSKMKLRRLPDDTFVMEFGVDSVNKISWRCRFKNGQYLATLAEIVIKHPEFRENINSYAADKHEFGSQLETATEEFCNNPLAINLTVEGNKVASTLTNGDDKKIAKFLGESFSDLLVDFLNYIGYKPKLNLSWGLETEDKDLPVYEPQSGKLIGDFVYGFHKLSEEILAKELQTALEGAGEW